MDKEKRQSNGTRKIPTRENKRRCIDCSHGGGCGQKDLSCGVRLPFEVKTSEQHLQGFSRVRWATSKSNRSTELD